MASVQIELSRVTGKGTPVEDATTIDSEAKTSSASWSESAVIAYEIGTYWTIVAGAGDILFRFGNDPENSGGEGRRLPAGMVRNFRVDSGGQKVAIKDAT